MAKLVLIRHGQSQWNLENRFTGWVDIPLSVQGREEAVKAGKQISDINFDIGFTSTLVRAHETLSLVCAELKDKKVPIIAHKNGKEKAWAHYISSGKELLCDGAWELNERYYGDLQGLNKADTAAKYGDEQVHIWRRSFDIKPPRGESLEGTSKRTIPYFKKAILPQLKAGKNVLVVAHGNSLRSIVMYLENVPEDKIPTVELATGLPIIYEVDENGKIQSNILYRV